MIEKIDYYNVFQCDACEEEQGFHEAVPFKDCTAQLKADGWEVWKNPDGTWEHFCCEACRRASHFNEKKSV